MNSNFLDTTKQSLNPDNTIGFITREPSNSSNINRKRQFEDDTVLEEDKDQQIKFLKKRNNKLLKVLTLEQYIEHMREIINQDILSKYNKEELLNCCLIMIKNNNIKSTLMKKIYNDYFQDELKKDSLYNNLDNNIKDLENIMNEILLWSLDVNLLLVKSYDEIYEDYIDLLKHNLSNLIEKLFELLLDFQYIYGNSEINISKNTKTSLDEIKVVFKTYHNNLLYVAMNNIDNYKNKLNLLYSNQILSQFIEDKYISKMRENFIDLKLQIKNFKKIIENMFIEKIKEKEISKIVALELLINGTSNDIKQILDKDKLNKEIRTIVNTIIRLYDIHNK